MPACLGLALGVAVLAQSTGVTLPFWPASRLSAESKAARNRGLLAIEDFHPKEFGIAKHTTLQREIGSCAAGCSAQETPAQRKS